jgi:hypothetical protein
MYPCWLRSKSLRQRSTTPMKQQQGRTRTMPRMATALPSQLRCRY